jgi:hypothetical protein
LVHRLIIIITEIISNFIKFQSQPSKFSHIYDFIKHWHVSTPLKPEPTKDLTRVSQDGGHLPHQRNLPSVSTSEYTNLPQTKQPKYCQNILCSKQNGVHKDSAPFCLTSLQQHQSADFGQNGVGPRHGLASVASDFTNSDYSGPDPPLPVYQVNSSQDIF